MAVQPATFILEKMPCSLQWHDSVGTILGTVSKAEITTLGRLLNCSDNYSNFRGGGAKDALPVF